MKSPIASAAIYTPILSVFFGVLIAYNSQSDNDWLGLGAMFKIGLSILVGGVIAVAFSILSYKNKEPRWEISLITAIPATMFLLYIGLLLLGSLARN